MAEQHHKSAPKKKGGMHKLPLPALLANYVVSTFLAIIMFGSAFGTVAGITMALFCLACGMIGIEAIQRRREQDKIKTKVDVVSSQQDRLSRELARNRNEIDSLKDDLADTARTMRQTLAYSHTASQPAANTGPQQPVRDDEDTGILHHLRQQYEKMAFRRPDHAEQDASHAALHRADMPEPQIMSQILPDEAMAELLHRALENDKIEVFAQPIVRLPSRKMEWLELYARVRAKPGVYIPAQHYRPIAEKENLMTVIDNTVLLRCLDLINQDFRKNASMTYFVNIAVTSLKDPSFMNDLLEFLRKKRSMAERIVFEMAQKDIFQQDPDVEKIMKALGQLGCRFSMDNVEQSTSDIARLKALNIRFIKMNISRILALGEGRDGQFLFSRMRRALDNAGIVLIAAHVEEEEIMPELLDFDVDYGSGYLFGKPDHEIAYKTRKMA